MHDSFVYCLGIKLYEINMHFDAAASAVSLNKCLHRYCVRNTKIYLKTIL